MGFFLIVEILLTNSVQELLISKVLMGASKNNMIFVQFECICGFRKTTYIIIIYRAKLNITFPKY